MKFYLEWKDAYNPYDEWVRDSENSFKTFEDAMDHIIDSLDIYKTLEHRILLKRKGHKAVTMATFLPFPEEDII